MKAYYQWTLTPFLDVKRDIAVKLNDLLHQQTILTDVTKLLDYIADIVNNYRNFLQHDFFQKFLLKCIDKASEKYNEMNRQIMALNNQLNNEQDISKGIKEILQKMTTDMTKRLSVFTMTTRNFNNIVGAPDFTVQQRQFLSIKIEMIEKQFSKIFNENAGLSSWFSKSSDLIGTASTESSNDTPRRVDPVTLFRSVRSFNPGSSMSLRNNIISVDRVIALHQLAHQCYDSLSSLSKQDIRVPC